MKKTPFICAAVLSSVCAYAETPVEIASSDFTGGSTTLDAPFALNATQWSIETTFTYKSDTSMNSWGTTILCTTSDLTKTDYANDFQVWAGTGGKLVVKGCGFDDNSRGTTLVNDGTLQSGSTYTVVLDVVYNETKSNYTTSLTLKGFDGVQIGATKTSTYTFTTSDVVNKLYTACKDGVTTVEGNKSYSATSWDPPTVTLKTSGVLVPEPATATLSLLALAGLAARRRRH